MKAIVLTAVLAAALAACTTNDPATMRVTDEPGVSRQAEPSNYEQAIRDYFSKSLKDPESLRLRNLQPPQPRVEARLVVLAPSSVLTGPGRATRFNDEHWLVTVEANAKNSYGAYTGYRLHEFHFRGDRIVHVIDRAQEQEEAQRAYDRLMRACPTYTIRC